MLSPRMYLNWVDTEQLTLAHADTQAYDHEPPLRPHTVFGLRDCHGDKSKATKSGSLYSLCYNAFGLAPLPSGEKPDLVLL